ncbi:cell envelope integrity protein TolA [Pseudooceanicola sp. LIPI14-2-Ac024]|uniref:cell envelope integrity protein TolA n=1 Tax=Pseudooceanicola sp. LIPI14-2-Ac024 TaxID=3344875 RepID=UPI0035CEEAA1
MPQVPSFDRETPLPPAPDTTFTVDRPLPPEEETATETPEITQDTPPERPDAPVPEAPQPVEQAALPQIDTEVPPPPETAAPTSSPRPPVRPEQPKPAPERPTQSTESSAPRQATRSAGSGGSAQAGIAQSSGAKTLSQSQVQSAMSSWGAQIRARIERRKRHPGGRGGRVTLQLTVSSSGQITGAQVARSSGNPRLDQAAMAAVRQAGRMPAAPAGLSNPSYTFNLPMDFN